MQAKESSNSTQANAIVLRKQNESFGFNSLPLVRVAIGIALTYIQKVCYSFRVGPEKKARVLSLLIEG